MRHPAAAHGSRPTGVGRPELESAGLAQGVKEGPVTKDDRAQTFERDSREIARARGFVTDALSDWGLEADRDALELMVSELVSNALVHGTGRSPSGSAATTAR